MDGVVTVCKDTAAMAVVSSLLCFDESYSISRLKLSHSPSISVLLLLTIQDTVDMVVWDMEDMVEWDV